MSIIKVQLAAVIASLGAVTFLLSASPAQAGDGFPPFGAWAYGTRGPSWGAGYGGPAFGSGLSFHSSVGFRSSWHGGIGHVGFGHQPWHFHRVAYPRIGYVSRYSFVSTPWNCYPYRSYYFAPQVSYLSVNAPWCLPTYRSFYFHSGFAPVVAPPLIVAPPVLVPSAVPCITPTVTAIPLAGFVSQTNQTAPTQVSDVTESDLPVHYVVQETPHVVRRPQLTSYSSGDATLDVELSVPAELLAAADRILAAGGHREAAVAYAQLTARYGSTSQLLGRRFIAQVMSHDYDQAAVISASARFAGTSLGSLEYLPSEGLAGLGIDPITAQAVAEQLAAFALDQPTAAEPLASVAYWLQLRGDADRANLFFQRVEQLENAAVIAETTRSTAGSKTKLIAVE